MVTLVRVTVVGKSSWLDLVLFARKPSIQEGGCPPSMALLLERPEM